MRLLRILIVILPLFFQASCKKPATEVTGAEEHGEHRDHEESIAIDKERLDLIGLKTQVLKRKVVRQRINATAEIQFNANKLFHISPRVKGKVDEIFADFGDEVVKGQGQQNAVQQSQTQLCRVGLLAEGRQSDHLQGNLNGALAADLEQKLD